MSDPIEIARIRKNARADIRITLRKYKGGRIGVHIGEFEQNGTRGWDSKGSFVAAPTLLPEIARGIDKALSIAAAAGLLEPQEKGFP